MTLALAKSIQFDVDTPSTEENHSFSNQVDLTAVLATNLVQTLSGISDAEVSHVRRTAQKLGIYAWILECACDAEIWSRHEQFKSAPGRSDTEGTGLMPAVRRRVEEVGYSPKTIRLNYRIFRTFKDRLRETVHILPEKDFYIAALKYKENPNQALDIFIEERKKNAHFRPIDAKRLLAVKVVQERIAQIDETVEVQDTIRDHVDIVISRINEFKRDAPDRRLVTSFYEEWCRQLKEYLEDYSLTVNEEKILRAIERGNHKESQIASYTQLPIKSVSLILNELEEKGECESVLQRGETEVARGGHIRLWHKIGDPTGDTFSRQKNYSTMYLGESEDSLNYD